MFKSFRSAALRLFANDPGDTALAKLIVMADDDEKKKPVLLLGINADAEDYAALHVADVFNASASGQKISQRRPRLAKAVMSAAEPLLNDYKDRFMIFNFTPLQLFLEEILGSYGSVNAICSLDSATGFESLDLLTLFCAMVNQNKDIIPVITFCEESHAHPHVNYGVLAVAAYYLFDGRVQNLDADQAVEDICFATHLVRSARHKTSQAHLLNRFNLLFTIPAFPNPNRMLLTSISLQLFADRHGVDPKHLTVTIENNGKEVFSSASNEGEWKANGRREFVLPVLTMGSPGTAPKPLTLLGDCAMVVREYVYPPNHGTPYRRLFCRAIFSTYFVPSFKFKLQQKDVDMELPRGWDRHRAGRYFDLPKRKLRAAGDSATDAVSDGGSNSSDDGFGDCESGADGESHTLDDDSGVVVRTRSRQQRSRRNSLSDSDSSAAAASTPSGAAGGGKAGRFKPAPIPEFTFTLSFGVEETPPIASLAESPANFDRLASGSGTPPPSNGMSPAPSPSSAAAPAQQAAVAARRRRDNDLRAMDGLLSKARRSPMVDSLVSSNFEQLTATAASAAASPPRHSSTGDGAAATPTRRPHTSAPTALDAVRSKLANDRRLAKAIAEFQREWRLAPVVAHQVVASDGENSSLDGSATARQLAMAAAAAGRHHGGNSPMGKPAGGGFRATSYNDSSLHRRAGSTAPNRHQHADPVMTATDSSALPPLAPPAPSKGGPAPPSKGAPPAPSKGTTAPTAAQPPLPSKGGPPVPSKGQLPAPSETAGAAPPVPSKGGPGVPTKGAPPVPSKGAPPMPAKGAPPMPSKGGPPVPSKGGPPMPSAGGPPLPGGGPAVGFPTPGGLFGAPAKPAYAGPKLKNFFWRKVAGDRLRKSRLWSDMPNEDDDDENRIPKPDENLLVQLFEQKKVEKKAEVVELSSDGKRKSTAVPGQRQQNVSIALRKLKMTPAEIRDAYFKCAMTDDELSVLLPTVPQPDEMKNLAAEAEAGNFSWGDAENLLYELMTQVPDAAERLALLRSARSVEHMVEEARSSIQRLQELVEALTSPDAPLNDVLRFILSVGNIMNRGSANADAKGFLLESLGTMTFVKTTDGKSTLLEVVIQQLHDSNKLKLLEWPAGIIALMEKAKTATTDAIAMQVGQLNQAMNRIRRAIEEGQGKPARVSPSGVRDALVPTLEAIYRQHTAEVARVCLNHQTLKEDIAALQAFYADDGKDEQVVLAHLGTFAREFEATAAMVTKRAAIAAKRKAAAAAAAVTATPAAAASSVAK